KRQHPALPVVMISGHGNIETAVAAIKLGAFDFIEKPFKAEHFLVVIERALETARLRREYEELRIKVGNEVDLLGSSSAVGAVRQQIERVAPTSSRVLITGPAGVGKEVTARLLHQRSRRGIGPVVGLTCATVWAGRPEIALFG